ncbi:FliC/FljB family flagellin [Achromobacter aegrifaciens]|uniref:FliC/FljB family flagellin n=1 Tax=Achromobacter aegrifaciens TaxID=1287736 RepID=UPI000F73FC0C|nr:FliC/FljB family flagellin [Achromobacter aegrifaciens]RSE95059.1 FliC/FljB family flagellin [Achromobacter aegrifaciens]
MAAVINTNYLSLVAQNNLNKSQSALGSAIERLSSGLRINSAKDDAAGQAIANRFTANVKGLTQAARNANDGISIAQTTEGALNEINNNLQRIRQLSVQATNGTNSGTDLNSIQDEIKQRLEEIDRVSAQTQFNGVKVLAKDSTLKIQVGANDGETIDIDLKEITAATLGLQGFNVNGTNGVPAKVAAGATTAQMKAAYGESTAVDTLAVGGNAAFATALESRLGVAAGKVTLDADAYQDGNGNWFAKVSLDGTDATTAAALKASGFDTKGLKADYFIALDPQTAAFATNTATFTLDGSKVSLSSMVQGSTSNALSTMDSALSAVDSLRSSLGALQNRFESTVANLNNTITNLSAARSRIEDSDYATEVSNMTKNQILQQAGTSVLAQANQVPQNVLSLLR